MNIETMLLGHKARADEDRLNELRQDCVGIMALLEGKDAWALFYDEAKAQVEDIDGLIEGLRREDRYAEQNAKYREGRPNA